jgi:purine operon repressor
MARIKRMERIVAFTQELTNQPAALFPLAYFCEKFGVAKSTLSEDVQTIRNGLEEYHLGTIETVAGAGGGVRFIPHHAAEDDAAFLEKLGEKLANPERILPGGMIYMNDLLFTPSLLLRMGEIIMQRSQTLAPDYIMTVESKGIPLALATARAFNVPMVMARKQARITEGPAVSISYLSGSTKKIQSMSLPKRAMPVGAKVLIVDDFMQAGGTAQGLKELASEVGAKVVGVVTLIATKEPAKKKIDDYSPLFILKNVNEEEKKIDIFPRVI